MLARFISISFVLGVGATGAVACSTSSSPSPPAGPPGGAVAGTKDDHCGSRRQKTSAAACHPSTDGGVDALASDAASDATSDASDASDSAIDDAGDDSGGDAGDAADETGGSEYGPTLFNADGDDDDCKYHVSWTSDAVYESTDVVFHLQVMRKADGVWACGAKPYVEAYLSDTHPAPNSGQRTSEVGIGQYDIGPIRFDAKGRWTVRFHIFGDCSDLSPDSPHGHAAFYVDVP